MPKGEKFKVLVADDEELICAHIKRKIEKINPRFQVVGTAFDGQELLKMVSQHHPDVVFTDILMPVLGGLEVAQRISERYPHIKTIIVSGYNDFSYAQKAIQSRVSSYLLKPVKTDELAELLQSLAVELDSDNTTLSETTGMEYNMNPEQLCTLLKSYIRCHYQESISFNKLSAELHYSPAYITKVFSQYTGVTPVKYLTDLRINLAIRMIEKSQAPVAQVGKEVGYPNQYYFSRVFKQHTGMSPMEYRAACACGTLPGRAPAEESGG